MQPCKLRKVVHALKHLTITVLYMCQHVNIIVIFKYSCIYDSTCFIYVSFVLSMLCVAIYIMVPINFFKNIRLFNTLVGHPDGCYSGIWVLYSTLCTTP